MHVCSTSSSKEVCGSLFTGLLCFVDPSLGPTSPNAPFRNIFWRHGVPKLFTMLLEKFHVGLWSSMTKLKLFPLLRYILPKAVMKRLSFIFSKGDYRDFKSYLLCYKMCDTLFRKPASRGVCVQNQILFVNVRPLSMRYNTDAICYLSYPLLESSVIQIRVELFLMLQLILYHSFIPCIGLPLLKIIWCTL